MLDNIVASQEEGLGFNPQKNLWPNHSVEHSMLLCQILQKKRCDSFKSDLKKGCIWVKTLTNYRINAELWFCIGCTVISESERVNEYSPHSFEPGVDLHYLWFYKVECHTWICIMWINALFREQIALNWCFVSDNFSLILWDYRSYICFWGGKKIKDDRSEVQHTSQVTPPTFMQTRLTNPWGNHCKWAISLRDSTRSL